MVLEIADIRVASGKNEAFEAAIERGVAAVVTRCAGYRAHQVHKGIESPDRYVLMIWWDTLENHTVDFRQGPLFAEWRAIVGPYFSVPPSVEHFTLVHESA